MKHSISLSLYFLVLLGLLLQEAPVGNTFAQLRKSGEIKMSPEAWPQGELEKYWQLQKDYNQQQQAVEGGQGVVAVTSDAFAAAFTFRDGRIILAKQSEPLDIVWSQPLPAENYQVGPPESHAYEK